MAGKRDSFVADLSNQRAVSAEISRIVRARKEKIDAVIKDACEIEEQYLTDAECNLIKGIKLAKESMIALESSNKALQDELVLKEKDARDSETKAAEAIRDKKEAQEKVKSTEQALAEQTANVRAIEEAHTLFRAQLDAWMIREDESVRDLQERLEMLRKELGNKSTEIVSLNDELAGTAGLVERVKELEAKEKDSELKIMTLSKQNVNLKEKVEVKFLRVSIICNDHPSAL